VERQLSIGLVAMAAAMAALLAAHGPSAEAQPVASIALPDPGGTEQLYSGCNAISLTFPHGTASETVVAAVTPAGAVESLWRFDPPLKKWEGFSPAAPRASDLLKVDFLDSVWLCVAAAPGGTAPPPSPSPAGTPVDPSATADLVLTDLFPKKLPVGDVYASITNHGPGKVKNTDIDLSCSLEVIPYQGPPTTHQAGGPVSVSLSRGQTAELPTGITIDISQAVFDITCTIQAPLYDPDLVSNKKSKTFPTADVEVIDLILHGPPASRDVQAVLTNKGPDTLVNVPAKLECESRICPDVGLCFFLGPPTRHPPVPVQLRLSPGQTQVVQTPLTFDDTNYYAQTMTCTLAVQFLDPNPSNARNETPVQ